jgi:hypothetical protein
MTPDVGRVVHRYQLKSAILDESDTEVLISEGTSITAADIARLLLPVIGPLYKLRMRFPPHGPATMIAWTAEDEAGKPISGRVQLRIFVESDVVSVWADLLVHLEGGETIRYASDSSQQ